MTWILKDQEVRALLASDGKKRFEYFVHRICDTRKVWALYSDGWASLGDDKEKLIPFWPHEKYAALMAKDEWASFKPQAIALDTFLFQWIPGLAQEGILPAIFPVPTGQAVVISLEALEVSIRNGLGPEDDELLGNNIPT